MLDEDELSTKGMSQQLLVDLDSQLAAVLSICHKSMLAEIVHCIGIPYFPGLHHLLLPQQSRTKADQQLRVMKVGDELLGASYLPSTSTGMDAQEATSFTIGLSTPHTVRNGESATIYSNKCYKQHLDL